MASLDYGDLLINGTVIAYDGKVKIEKGTKTRVPNPQINGEVIYTTDISTQRSKITVPIRVSPASNEQFDAFYANDDNNTISFRDSNFSKCVMEVIPEREDQEVVEYVFFGNPEV
jgi:hypothetical protein